MLANEFAQVFNAAPSFRKRIRKQLPSMQGMGLISKREFDAAFEQEVPAFLDVRVKVFDYRSFQIGRWEFLEIASKRRGLGVFCWVTLQIEVAVSQHVIPIKRAVGLLILKVAEGLGAQVPPGRKEGASGGALGGVRFEEPLNKGSGEVAAGRVAEDGVEGLALRLHLLPNSLQVLHRSRIGMLWREPVVRNPNLHGCASGQMNRKRPM